MIEVSRLTKRYGKNYALKDISFHVDEGEILGFLGPNGAGKTTTMNIITGYLSSNEGTVTVAGYNILEDPIKAKRHIGYLPEQPPLYLDMTVKDYLNFVYELKKCKLSRDAHIREICRLVKISNVYDRLIKNLSKGYRQRVGIAQALIGNPEVLILDEPTVGLDPKQIIEIRTLIKNLGKRHTVILSSHILTEVQSVCEHIVIIDKGRIVADDTTANLSKQMTANTRYNIRVQGPEEAVRRAISGISGVKQIVSLGSRESDSVDFLVEVEEGKDIRGAIFTLLSDRKWPLLSLESGEMSLEDIFLKFTGEDTQKKRGSRSSSHGILEAEDENPEMEEPEDEDEEYEDDEEYLEDEDNEESDDEEDYRDDGYEEDGIEDEDESPGEYETEEPEKEPAGAPEDDGTGKDETGKDEK